MVRVDLGVVPVCLVLVDSLGMGHDYFAIPACVDSCDHAGAGGFQGLRWMGHFGCLVGPGFTGKSINHLIPASFGIVGLVPAMEEGQAFTGRCRASVAHFLLTRRPLASAQ